VHVNDAVDIARWRAAYLSALRHYARGYVGRKVTSIFFGGGTPSLMPPDLAADIIAEVRTLWPVDDDVEITLEANPTSSERQKFAAFKQAGINRLSLGVQALNDADLSFLGRAHDAGQALAAIETAKSVFDRFSFDLIYARPDQSLKAWEEELKRAAELAAGHLSLYQLTVERNTPFYLKHARGEFYLPEDGMAADFYMLTQDILGAAGLPAYEVSNHAAPGHESRHNLVYWHYGDYLGIGPGAHGRITSHNKVRYATRDHYAPEKWLQWVEERGAGAHEMEVLSDWDQGAEGLMMGLRLYQGINIAPFRQFIDLKAIDRLASEGWLCYDEGHLKLTPDGMLRLNMILPYLIKDETDA
tara:strand:- start:12581 stop:13654 length:1074 start_codon:yes stop_codon:yes gene_type:complete